MEHLKYPIGKYVAQPFSEQLLSEWLLAIEALPNQVEAAVQNLDAAQLQTPYRPEGWTVHQLVHHIADSHTNAYIRFKLGLTEDNPVIKPYNENAWAKMADTQNLPINISLTILHAIHLRWWHVLKAITPAEWERTIYHPEHQQTMTLWYLLGMYVWHGRHHTAHITSLRNRMGWF